MEPGMKLAVLIIIPKIWGWIFVYISLNVEKKGRWFTRLKFITRESTAFQYFSGLLVSHNNKIKKMYKQRANDRINIFKMKEKKKENLWVMSD